MSSLSKIFPLFTLSLILLSSQTTAGNKKVSSDLLAMACNGRGSKGWDIDLCLRILKSRPNIMSAKNDRVNFTLRIIESGIENTTNTQTYIKQRLSDTKIIRSLRLALKECVDCFEAGIGSFGSAHGEIKDDKEYSTADYDLSVIYGQVGRCGLFLSDYKVKEPMVSIGMKYVTYFSGAAKNIVEDLESAALPPPPL